MAKGYFIFNGKDSRTLGITCDGGHAWDSAERDISAVSVPAHNGDYLFDNMRFKNQQLTYHCFVDQDRFQANAMAIRSWLLGVSGYAILTDSYNPGLERYARLVGNIEFTTWGINNRGAEFDITFDCDPRKFLTNDYASGLGSMGIIRDNTTSMVVPANIKNYIKGMSPEMLLNAYTTQSGETAQLRIRISAAKEGEANSSYRNYDIRYTDNAASGKYKFLCDTHQFYSYTTSAGIDTPADNMLPHTTFQYGNPFMTEVATGLKKVDSISITANGYVSGTFKPHFWIV